jgi:hypothetical protein
MGTYIIIFWNFQKWGSLVDRLIPDFRTLVQDYYLGGDCSVIAMNSYYKKDEQLKTMLSYTLFDFISQFSHTFI